MVGTLIKTMTVDGLFVGIITEWWYVDDTINVNVIWNDCDITTETFYEHEDYDTAEHCFYDKGRWWLVNENFYKLKRLLEGK